VTDFLETKRNEIAKRLAELKPLVDEYSLLQAAATALDTVPSVNGAAAPASSGRSARRRPGRPRGTKSAAKPASTPTGSKPASTTKPRRKGRAGRPKGSGKRAGEALSLITEQPGITIPELAARMGIKSTYFYRLLPTLEKAGSAVKRGKGWHPAAK
jgi:hypothetical protein